MLPMERQQWILNKAIREGRVYINQLAEELEVNAETIRRDIRTLARDKRLIKTHGGAMLVQEMARERGLEYRLQQQPDMKRRIGLYAMTMIQDGDIVYFPGIGACVCEVASLRDVHDLVIVTHSLDIASIVCSKLKEGEITGKLVLLGGCVDPMQRATWDFTFARQISDYYFTKVFVGATALSEDGPLLYSADTCEMNRYLIRQTEKVILLAESAKFLKNSFSRYATWEDIDCFITDDTYPIPPDGMKALKENEVQVYRIGSNGQAI